jgi:hypothetical protein
MNTDERQLWMEVYVACVRAGKSFIVATADEAVKDYRKALKRLSEQ